MSTEVKWIKVSEQTAPEGELVETKLDDHNGCRNVQVLRRNGNLWFTSDDSMYVYYTPTHWHPISKLEVDAIKAKLVSAAQAAVDRAKAM